MKNRIAHVVTHAFAVVLAAANEGAGRIESFLYFGMKRVQNAAYGYGAEVEQAIVNRAQQDLAAARRRLEQANTEAKAVLRAMPERMAALAKKVYE
jgi:hypothetical protein